MSRIAEHSPSWMEVIFGAVLSFVLGIALGVVVMVLKPVVVAKELPQEPVADAVYYVEGLRGDSNKARLGTAKYTSFVQGQSVKIAEDELNALAVASSGKPLSGKSNTPTETVSMGMPNARVHDGVLQLGAPVAINLLGIEYSVIMQVRGGFEKRGEIFTYEPSEVYFGSCPLQKLPGVTGYLRGKVMAAQKIPADAVTAWTRLSNVSLEGNALVLTAP